MGNVPLGLFRRKMAFRALEEIDATIEAFQSWAGRDNYYAAMASYNDIAARFAGLSGRPDLAQQFEQQRDAMIAKGIDPGPTSPGHPKGPKTPKKP